MEQKHLTFDHCHPHSLVFLPPHGLSSNHLLLSKFGHDCQLILKRESKQKGVKKKIFRMNYEIIMKFLVLLVNKGMH